MFIVFEGIDGSGKSTQIQRLQRRLQSLGKKSFLEIEPTNWPIGRMIRNIFKSEMPAEPETVAALFAADRLEHILNPESGMLSALSKDTIVLCDRYLLSSLAYQGAHVPMEWVMQLNQKAKELLLPDITIYLDMPPEMALERITQNRESLEIYETLDNLKAVHNRYDYAMNNFQVFNKLIKINANQGADEVEDNIWHQLEIFFN